MFEREAAAFVEAAFNSGAVNGLFLFRGLLSERFTFYRMHLKCLFGKCQICFDRSERVQCLGFVQGKKKATTTCLLLFLFKIVTFAALPVCCDIEHLKAPHMFSWRITVVWGWVLNKKTKKTAITLIAVKGVSKQRWLVLIELNAVLFTV